MITINVKVNSERPDFRVFGAYLFGDDFYNYDSDGDSFPVSSRVWTELYMRSRQNSDLCFEIWKINDSPLIFEVSSKKKEVASIIAYFLARETNGELIAENNNIVPLESIMLDMGDFNLEKHLELADSSIWRKATEDNPYPNLSEN